MDCRQSKRNDAPADDLYQWPADFSRADRGGLSLRVGDGKDRRNRDAKFRSTVRKSSTSAGNFLAPGFIDLHVHGAVGRDTMEGTTEAFRAICDYHAGGGTTSLLLTTVTAPIDEIVRVVHANCRRAARNPATARRACRRPLYFAGETRRAADGIHRRAAGRFGDAASGATAGDQTRHARSGGAGRARSDRSPNERWESRAAAATAPPGTRKRAPAFERGMRQVTHTFNCMSSLRRRGGERVAGLLEFALERAGDFLRADR